MTTVKIRVNIEKKANFDIIGTSTILSTVLKNLVFNNKNCLLFSFKYTNSFGLGLIGCEFRE
jgi:hypothetical protein